MRRLCRFLIIYITFFLHLKHALAPESFTWTMSPPHVGSPHTALPDLSSTAFVDSIGLFRLCRALLFSVFMISFLRSMICSIFLSMLIFVVLLTTICPCQYETLALLRWCWTAQQTPSWCLAVCPKSRPGQLLRWPHRSLDWLQGTTAPIEQTEWPQVRPKHRRIAR